MGENINEKFPRIKPYSDCGLLVEFENTISMDVNSKVVALYETIKKLNFNEVIEMIPTYRSLGILYDSNKIDYEDFKEKIQNIANEIVPKENPEKTIIKIPVLYSDEYGIDLDTVASNAKLTKEEVISIHSSTDYYIYMMGFMPGFAYLGGLDERIHTPRLEKPRTKIQAGSVGIADSQTGIYPLESPGGWQIIGRTPLKLYDKDSKDPILLKAGTYIRFIPIDKGEYEKIEKGNSIWEL